MRVVGWLVLGALLIPCVPGNAQAPAGWVPSPVLTLTADFGRIPVLTPDAEAQTFDIEWQYMFPSQAQAAAAAAYGSAIIHWDPPPVCDSPGITIAGPQTTMVPFSSTSPDYIITGSTPFQFTASRAAPGLQLIRCHFTAYAEEAGPSAPATNVAVSLIPVTVVFHGAVEASAVAPHLMSPPGEPIAFQVEMRSTANSRATVAIEALELDEGWSVVLPKRLFVDPGQQVQVEIIVQPPAGQLWTDHRQDLALRMTPIAQLDEARQGEPSTLELVAQSRGVDVVSSGGGLALLGLIAAVGLVGWARLRRKATQE